MIPVAATNVLVVTLILVCLFVFVSSSDFKSSARCPRWKTLAEDQQKPGALRHHVDLLQPWHGDGLLGDSRGCLFKPLAV